MKSNRILGLVQVMSVVVVVLMAVLMIEPAAAQDATEPADNKCLVCHEDLYYQHDTGKSFCMCEASMTCACCHGGDDQAVDLETAHTNMNLKPITDDVMVCQRCHTQDYQEKAVEFAAIAGISPPPTEIAVTVISSGNPVPINPALGLDAQSPEFWRSALLVLVGVLFLSILVFGYRCWRADCMAKQLE